MDIIEADRLLRFGKKVKYSGTIYSIIELVIWYKDDKRRASFILGADNGILRVNIEECEELGIRNQE